LLAVAVQTTQGLVVVALEVCCLAQPYSTQAFRTQSQLALAVLAHKLQQPTAQILYLIPSLLQVVDTAVAAAQTARLAAHPVVAVIAAAHPHHQAQQDKETRAVLVVEHHSTVVAVVAVQEVLV